MSALTSKHDFDRTTRTDSTGGVRGVNRRDFLRSGMALGALFGRSVPELRAHAGRRVLQTDASTIGRGNLALVNARVLTVDASQPSAQAVLVRSGRIARVGTTDDVKASAAGIEVF